MRGENGTFIQRPQGGRRPVSTVLWLGLFFAVGFVVTAVVINLAVTNNYWRPNISQFDKLAELALISDRVNVLFVGSSHYTHGIIPELFDATTEACGVTTNSYNLSVDGLFVYEQLDLLRELQDLKLPNLEYVVCEPRILSTPVLGQVMSHRVRYASTAWNTLLSMGLKYYSSRPPRLINDVGAYGMKAIAFGIHLSNIGVLSDCLLPDPVPPKAPTLDPLRGYEPYATPYARGDEPAPLRYSPEAGNPIHPSEYETDLLVRAVTLVKELGAEPIVAVTPFDPASRDIRLQSGMPLGLPRRFPGLKVLNYAYDGEPKGVYLHPEFWYDRDHINDAGARLFTAQLARDFVAMVRQGEVCR